MSSAKELDFDRPRRPPTPPAPPRANCAVCGLRADVLICKECAVAPEAAITWLTRLPGLNARQAKALALL